MAFPTTSILDNFNRANEGPPPSSNWTADTLNVGVTGHSVVSNQCVAASGSSHTWWNASTFGPDQEAFATWSQVGAAGFVGFHMRIQSPGTSSGDAYECVFFQNGTIQVVRVIDAYTSEVTLLNDSIATPNDGDKVGVEVIGSGATVTIRMLKDTGSGWTEVGTVDDTGATRITASGNIGLLGGDTDDIADDFGGGTVVAANTRRYSLTTVGVG